MNQHRHPSRIAASFHSRSLITQQAHCNLLASRHSILRRIFPPLWCRRLWNSHHAARHRHRPPATAHAAHVALSTASTAAAPLVCKLLTAPCPHDVHDGCLAAPPPRFHLLCLAAGRLPQPHRCDCYRRRGLLGRVRDRQSAHRGLAVGAIGIKPATGAATAAPGGCGDICVCARKVGGEVLSLLPISSLSLPRPFLLSLSHILPLSCSPTCQSRYPAPLPF